MADIAAMAAVVLPCSSFLTPPKTVVMVLNMLLPAFPRLPLAVQSGSLGGDALKDLKSPKQALLASCETA